MGGGPRRLPTRGWGRGGGTIIGGISVLGEKSVGITHKLCGVGLGELGVPE